jgi:acyl transferase domain-containing protein/NAD(P)-dependent dehydrogenase (short-subunit alcohol dehydrogenase family)/acyl-CoA thioesterase FadM
MNFLAIQYRVLFHDTMAYGTHHFLTNFIFQCQARERLFFREIVDGSSDGPQMLENFLFLTQEAYARNMNSLGVGERAVVLMSVEEITAVSVRFCFRVLRHDGTPVSAGFQTVVAVAKETGRPTAPPAWMRSYGVRIRESLTSPTFADRVLSGRTRELFDAGTVALARQVGSERSFPSDGDFVCASTPLPNLEAGPIFLFPGQGSYDPVALRAMLKNGRVLADWISYADEIGKDLLGASLLDLLQSRSEDEHARRLAGCPDLAQLGITLLGLGSAQMLLEKGIRPAALVGHSLGEISALAIGGAFSVEDGLVVACLRIRTLRAIGSIGGMLAVLGPASARAQLLDGVRNAWLAVTNHDLQVVIGGTFAALEELEAKAPTLGLGTRRVMSAYPFHTPLLEPAIRVFADALGSLPTKAPQMPVYSPIDGRLFDRAEEIGFRLSEHFVRPLDFPVALRALRDRGAKSFVECGGTILGSFVRQVLNDEVKVFTPFPKGNENASVQAIEELRGSAQSTGDRRHREWRSKNDTDTHRVDREDVQIAIVAAGCVLPGAKDPSDLWQALLEGRSGLSDAATKEPEMAQDFLRIGAPQQDKTYSLLGGFILERPPVPTKFSAQEAAGFTSAQRFLASALDQCVEAVGDSPKPNRRALFLGATSDGIREFDEALLGTDLINRLSQCDASREERDRIATQIKAAFFSTGRQTSELAPLSCAREVGERILGTPLRIVLVDAACASSLQAVDLGVRSLRDGSCDMAFCGGFFGPGPANNCLFAQFGGLSAIGSRPFDRDADGVVFGEGAAVLALCRLSDALAASLKVLALIKGVGVSSDGRSASVVVPSAKGQILAMERAWARAGLDPTSAQYLEAHATSTPVGDATEFQAIKAVFNREAGGPPMNLGSLKAITGHTGWTAGAASIVKVCLAMSHKTMPGQTSFNAPPAAMKLGQSFKIGTVPEPWVDTPLRAGVSGFGFGGSNVHVVLESFDSGQSEIGPQPSPSPRKSLAVVGIGVQFATPERSEACVFREEDLSLPQGPAILPDVLEHMDRSHRLALRTAYRALAGVPWKERRKKVGVVLGLRGKTDLSLRVNHRLYADRVRRVTGGGVVVESILTSNSLPSGPYTLPGLMPNVAAGRIANFFDLQGPNLVLDAGPGGSLVEAFSLAEQLLNDETCELVLSGGLNAITASEVFDVNANPFGEGALLLAVTTIENASIWGVPVLATVRVDSGGPDRHGDVLPGKSPHLSGAEGIRELALALDLARTGSPSRVRLPGATLEVTGPIGVAPPIRIATARVWPNRVQTEQVPRSYAGRRVLLLTDGLVALTGELSLAAEVIVLSPIGIAVPGAVSVDMSSDTSVRSALMEVGIERFDTIIAVKRIGTTDGLSSLSSASRLLLDLLFVVMRTIAGPLGEGKVAVGTLCLDALSASGFPHPWTGLSAGLLKSVARELPKALCKAVVTGDDNIQSGLGRLAMEWGLGPRDGELETVWNPERNTLRLEELNRLAAPGDPGLGSSSVVLATGGARGVTNVLIEALVRQTQCTVVLVGRSAIDTVPSEIRLMDDESFDRSETEFYREEAAREPDISLSQLKRRFEAIRAAREAARSFDRLSLLPGRVHYRRIDLNDDSAVLALISSLRAEFGRLDLVVHGAGIQISGGLGKRSLEEFRQVVNTKVGTLITLASACASANPKVSFHVLSSTFSFLGNDGQPDYGSANEAMNRLAVERRSLGEDWTSIAWLGWASVGMTKGSEYAALAAARQLRPVTTGEGAALFTELLGGKPEVASIITISDRELEWYREPFCGQGNTFSGPSWTISLETFPLASNHIVGGKPTIPGSFEIDLAMQAARTVRPDWVVYATENLRWLRFVRVRDKKSSVLRSDLIIEKCSPNSCTIRVRLLSDGLHPSNHEVKSSTLHFECRVRLKPCAEVLPSLVTGAFGVVSDRLPDPYHFSGTVVRLSGPFCPITRIEISERIRRATFQFDGTATPTSMKDALGPVVLLDATCRFAMIHRDVHGVFPLYVPVACGELQIRPGTNDNTLVTSGKAITLWGDNPRLSEGKMSNRWAEACDPHGHVIFRAIDLVAKRVGEVSETGTAVGAD